MVVALYSFTSQNEEELSFQKGEKLEVIDRPANDPDWWMAKNQAGATGLVPKNYVSPFEDNNLDSLESVAVQKDLTKLVLNETSPILPMKGTDKFDITCQSWYFGCISRSQCDQMLNKHAEDGDFLIRDSETNVSAGGHFLENRFILYTFIAGR